MLHIASVIALAALAINGCAAATLKTCGGSLSGIYGDFQSPGFPDKYDADKTCVWNISAPDGYYIKLEFTQFTLEEHSHECEYDRVTVSEGEQRLALLCGTPNSDGPKEPIKSSNGSMQVELFSDYSDTAPGFWAHFAAVDIDECAVDNGGCNQHCHNYPGSYYCSCSANYVLQSDGKFCKVVCDGMTKTDLHGVISSPEYPDIYPDQSVCDWCITLPLGYQVVLTFAAMDIEEHHEVPCPYDKLKIDTGRSAKAGPYCGKTLPSPVISQANKMCLYFTSDDSVGHHGFSAKYKAKPLDCGNPGTPSNGQKIGRNYTFPSQVTYQCDSGFFLVGSSSRDCQTDGTWSGTTARCERVSCGDPGIPKHGTRTIIAGVQRTYVYEDKVKLDCNRFYSRLEGDAVRTCRESGRWSGTQLKCKPICGKTTYYNRVRIIGGSTARHGVYPWMAMLYYHPCNQTRKHCLFCGATILDNNYVLTAAHCTRGILGNSPFIIRVGAHQVRSDGDKEWWCQVEEIIEHPSYNTETFDYDAALIRVANCTKKTSPITTVDEIVFSDHIRPICLPNPALLSDLELYNAGSVGTAAGWGKRNLTTTSKGYSKVLRHVELAISDSNKCQSHFSRQDWEITPRMFCTLADGQDTCHGDSGGPYMIKRNPSSSNPKSVLLGVISWGDSSCATGYGVYTKVSQIVSWIDKTTGG